MAAMSTIGYYVPQTLLRHEGIRRRSKATLKAWAKVGVDPVALAEVPNWKESLSGVKLLRRHVQSDSAAANTARELFESGAIDHLHARLLAPTLGWSRLASRFDVSLEIHGHLWRPEHSRDFVARVAPFGLTSRALVRKAKAAAFVTHELANTSPYSVIPRKVVIGNGIELGEPLPAPANETPVVGVAIGTDAPWNGLDIMASWARRLPEIHFVVICPAKLAADLQKNPENKPLRFRPTRNRQDYLVELSQLDAAVGSLAAERKKIHELAALKVRDYLNVGIPTLLVTPDTNLMGVEDEAVPLRRKPLDLDSLQDWINSMRGRRVLDSTRRAVSIDVVEAQRLRAIMTN